MGEYNHTIDAKGRVIIPTKLRDGLGDSFVISKGLDGCLYIYENSEWESFEEKLSSLPMTNAKVRSFVRFFTGGADSVEVDKQGRILIPQSLRKHAELEKDVVFLGVGRKIELWGREKLDSLEGTDMDEIAGTLDELGIRI